MGIQGRFLNTRLNRLDAIHQALAPRIKTELSEVRSAKPKGLSAIGVTQDNLYNVALKYFKRNKTQDERTMAYTKLATKFEKEYGFEFFTVMRILDRAVCDAEAQGFTVLDMHSSDD